MHIVILGNGISGITAARFIRKLSDYQITVISKETDDFFSRTALMYIYMGHMRFKDTQPYEPGFWKKNRIDRIRGQVDQIDYSEKILHLSEQDFIDSKLPKSPSQVKYDKLILACGSASNKFGWPGQDLKKVQGLYTYQDVLSMEEDSSQLKRAVIVGGGLIGIEMAEMFHSRHIPVTILVREKRYWDMVLPKEESEMVGRHILEHGIDLRLETELKEIIGNDKGEAIAVMTNKEEQIDCGLVGLTAGVHPNVRWLKESKLEIERGIIVGDDLSTNVPDVYAIGDCAQLRSPRVGRRPIEAVWYTGRMMGETVAHTICGSQTKYDPGIWFNSAKFLDIEYQVYGTAPVEPTDGLDSVYWEHSDGRRSIRIYYDTASDHVVGFNLMGVRFRHEVCEKWIKEKTGMDQVVANLALANFDPEFYQAHHEAFVLLYNLKTGKNLKSQEKRVHNPSF